MKYFTEKEIEDFKNGSINYPMIIVKKEQHEAVQVSEVVAVSGMVDNNGTPSEIKIRVHNKGEESKLLTYHLVQQ